jgi:hypothetical protein
LSTEQLKVDGYWVVNGCQSLTALFNNTGELTDDLRLLTKFIQTKRDSELAKQVTKFSNNQNGVRPRDFMANNPSQIRLQNEFNLNYKGQYSFEIKRGEIHDDEKSIKISNETAGLLLMAFDLMEPWATHRKYQVFEDKYADLFSRPEVTSDRIVLCHVILEAVESESGKLENKLFAKYILTKYFLIYCIRVILDGDELKAELHSRPESFVRKKVNRDKFRNCILQIVSDLIVDLNLEIKDLGDDFDYRDKLRDSAWVKEQSAKLVGTHKKLVRRGSFLSFKDSWEGKTAKTTVTPLSSKSPSHKDGLLKTQVSDEE